MFKHKLKASLIHLVLSAILIALVTGSMLFFLFPTLFIGITDFKEIALLIISVDLILGPLLTFVVFQPKKKTLTFDLSIIAAIQLSALIYGVYALYQIHPVYITFNVDRFTLVTAKDAEPEKAKFKEYNVSKLDTAKLAFVKMPVDIEKRNEIAMTAAFGGGDLESWIEYYEPYKDNINHILARSLDPKIIFSQDNAKNKLTAFQKKFSNPLDTYAFLPLNSNTKNMVIVLDRESAEAVTTLDIDPWIISKK